MLGKQFGLENKLVEKNCSEIFFGRKSFCQNNLKSENIFLVETFFYSDIFSENVWLEKLVYRKNNLGCKIIFSHEKIIAC